MDRRGLLGETGAGLDQHVNPLMLLEPGNGHQSNRLVRRSRLPPPDVDPRRQNVDAPRWEAVRCEEASECLRRDHKGSEANQEGLDPEVTVEQPGAANHGPHRPGSGPAGKADEFLGEPVVGVDQPCSQRTCGRPTEQECPTILGVDDVSAA
jgi:hypothetical protein